MDLLLGKVTQQAMNYAIRSGVTITASYAIRQSSKLLGSTPKSTVKDEYSRLRQKLQHKIRIVSPAIDLIELIAARGNTSLESAVALVKELRLDIQTLGQRIAKAAEASARHGPKAEKWNAVAKAQSETEMAFINKDIRALLDRIEDAVPLINLAITTSGASLSTQLPQTVSPSRLLQASTFLTAGDTQYSMSPSRAVQIGPTFTLTVYMLFAGHNRPQDEDELRETTWKEVIHKARVKLRRVPLDLVVSTGSVPEATLSAEIMPPANLANSASAHSIRASSRADEYAYQLLMIEDFDDDRVHDFSDTPESPQPGAFDDVALAGIRETIPVHEISKIFYADTSKVLNIGSDVESNHPVLLLKRDLNAVPPRKMAEREENAWGEGGQFEEGNQELPAQWQQEQQEEQQYIEQADTDRQQDPWRLPPSLDPEWIAFEVYSESEPSDSDSEADLEDSTFNNETTDRSTAQLASHLSNVHLTSPSPDGSPQPSQRRASQSQKTLTSPYASKVLTSLSLLELLLRLTSLQQFQQQSHLSITDELLTFFLEESASTGAGGDERYRQQLRQDARRRVGWDVYDESPVKRRGEEYQYQYQDQDGYESPRAGSANGHGNAFGNGNGWSPMSPRDRNESGSGNSNAKAHRNGGGMMSPSPSPSPSPMPSPAAVPGQAGRTAWLRRERDASRKRESSSTADSVDGRGNWDESGEWAG